MKLETDKLEVGMHVRTDNGIIGKIYEKIGDMFTYKDSNRDYITYDLLHSEIIKASYNIIDILEVEDIISFYEDIDDYKKQYVIGIPDLITLDNIKDKITNDNIRLVSILTKEQFEQMAYIIEKGDDK